MASNTVSPSKPARPLSFMTRITPQIYLYTPDSSQTTAVAPQTSSFVPEPKLILFAAWMGAGDKHIAKYLTRYQTLYPTSQILLIKTNALDVLIPSRGKPVVEPAVPIIRSIIPPSKDDSQPRLLVHLFSNAGNAVMSHLYEHFASTARPGTDDDTVFPLHSTIYDSAPGVLVYKGTVLAFSAMVPKGWMRMLALPFIHVLFSLLYFYFQIPGLDFLAKYRERHNTKTLVREVRRTYFYSERDNTIPAWGIEKHAVDAREKGFEVRTEKFVGSQHVAHMPHDPERYWRVVKETWEGTQ